MAEFMNQSDVRRLLSSIYECFLTRALGVDPALNIILQASFVLLHLSMSTHPARHVK
jgi:hypothetical protein